MTHILNIITGFTFAILLIICGYFLSKAKDANYECNIDDKYDYNLKADLCLACIVIILMIRIIFMYIYK